MAETITYLDLVFHFTHGEPLYVQMVEDRDTKSVEDGVITIDVNEPESSRRVTVYHDKLNGIESVRRVVKVEPPQRDTILELS